MSKRDAIHPSLIVAAMMVVAGSPILAGTAAGQCVDYLDYLHPTTRVDTEGSVQDIAVDGSLLYLVDRFHGISIHDLDSPTPSVPLATFPTTDLTEAVVYRHPYLYLAGRGAGLIIVDVTDAGSPQLMGQLSPANAAVALILDGDHAFIADSGYGLLIVDVSDPASPTQIAGLPVEGGLDDVVLAGTIVFAAGGEGLAMIDVTDPVHPNHVQDIPLAGRVFSLGASGSLVFAGTGDLEIVSVANPTAPVLLATYPQTSTVTGVQADGSLVYIADFEKGFSILDIADPSRPVLLASQGTLHGILCLAVDGTRILAGDTSGLSVFDATNPATVSRSARVELGGPVGDLALDYDTVFIADRSQGLMVLRLDPVAGPGEVSRFDVPDGLTALDFDGRYLYATSGDKSLRVLDTSSSIAVSLAGRIGLSGRGEGVALIGSHACVVTQVGTSYGGLDVVDIDSPHEPEVIGSLSLETSYATALATDGTYVYLSNWEAGLQVVDVFEPSDPHLIAEVDTPGHARDVVVLGSRAYVASGKSLQVIDVTDPTAPFTLGGALLPTEVKRLAVLGNHVYVSTAGSGVTVFDAADPAEIQALGSVASGEVTSAIALHMQELIVATDTSGLLVYPAQCSGTLPPGPDTPDLHVLLSPAPNPSRQETTLRFNLPRGGDLKLEIYDVTGRRIIPLIDGPRGGGNDTCLWDGRDEAGRVVPAGFYLVRLDWNGYVETRRLIRLR